VYITIIDNNHLVNRPPVANPDVYQGVPNTPVTGDLVANDFDPDGDVITINTSPLIQPTHGTVIINPTGTFTYIPGLDYVGNDQFQYKICDNGVPSLCDSAWAFITIFPNNGANTTVAVDDGYLGGEDTPLTNNVRINDYDPQGNTQSSSLVSTPLHGTVTLNVNGTFTYVPGLHYFGPDHFVYRDWDNGSPVAFDTATVYITVLRVNAAPVIVNEHLSTCSSDSLTGNILTNGDHDPDSTALTVTAIIKAPSNGTFTFAGTGEFTYVPNPGYNGPDTVVVSVCDNGIPLPVKCTNDTLFISVHAAALADAGPSDTICSTNSYPLNGSSASNYTSLAWTSSGTGSFSNATVLHPVYMPSASDILDGHVTLVLTAHANDPCPSASDTMTLTISKQAIANAGPDQSTCEGVPYTFTLASAGNYSSLFWASTGTGTFNDPTVIGTTYTPSAADISAGFVKLILTANGITPCPAASDTMTLTITPSAIANAGSDDSVCGLTPYTLAGASASNYKSVTWVVTSGFGSFIDPHVVNAVYMPDTSDIITGTVILTLTIDPLGSCSVASDQMRLSFTGSPIANAGPNVTTCYNTPVTITGAHAVNYSSILWTLAPGAWGTLSGATTLTPTYAPSTNDLGLITLTMIIHGTGGCLNTIAISQMSIIIGQPIDANAGPNTTIPPHSNTTLFGNVVGGNSSAYTFSWEPQDSLSYGTFTDHPTTKILDGTTTFYMTVTDILTGCQRTDSVTVTINKNILRILAVNDYDTTGMNIPIDVKVLPNDIYSTDQIVGVTILANPTKGNAIVNSDNTIHYIPKFDSTGIDSLSYIVCYDKYSQACDTAEVYLFVSGDSPINWLIIRNVITPNGDGVNDGWYVEGIEKFPDNTVQIFNRWGDKIKSFVHYNNTTQMWKGDNEKGEPVPDGTYYYILSIQDGGTRTGWILVRGSAAK
jgi:gliding motility-associated-like protein